VNEVRAIPPACKHLFLTILAAPSCAAACQGWMKGYAIGTEIKKRSKFADTVVDKFTAMQEGVKS